MISKFLHSQQLRGQSHHLIPGGSHTYAKGDDQFPQLAPGFIERGSGCRVWDVDGNEFIEYGMGLRAVTLGHVYPPVVRAVQDQLLSGTNFTRPSPIEVGCASQFLSVVKGAEQVKFTKDGSTATTAAVRLARAVTGRDKVAICADHPFLSYDDWFIGTTEMNAGIPRTVAELTVTFRYNDLTSVKSLVKKHSGQIACLMLEASRDEEPRDDFLHQTQELCRRNGILFVLDENITGFRYHIGGAQHFYGVCPDLSIFGKAMANGFSLSALAGKREFMQLGGIQHEGKRVFLLSTTHGGETVSMAASIATIETYLKEPVIEHLHRQGERLAEGLLKATVDLGLTNHVAPAGRSCNLTFCTRDAKLRPSQAFRSLFLQEMIRRGILMPSLVVSYAHQGDDVNQTVEAMRESLFVYRQALEDGVEKYLVGPPSLPVFRAHN